MAANQTINPAPPYDEEAAVTAAADLLRGLIPPPPPPPLAPTAPAAKQRPEPKPARSLLADVILGEVGGEQLLGLALDVEAVRHDEDRTAHSHAVGRFVGAAEMYAYLHGFVCAEVLALVRAEARRRTKAAKAA